MIKVLLIGCGNIGAGYDLNNNEVIWSHAKAFSQKGNIKLTVFDQDQQKSKAIAEKYDADLLLDINQVQWKDFDIVSITTPTVTHFEYLRMVLGNVPVIICEKPVVSDLKDIHLLKELYEQGNTKILVNYMRRFQPAYESLKNFISEKARNEPVRGFIVKYKRGFLNNASHAIDLLEYLFDETIHPVHLKTSNVVYDSFDYDPTITGSLQFLNSPLSFVGVPNVTYSIFELELFFEKSKIVICHSGDEIRSYEEQQGKLNETLLDRKVGILKFYMVPVIEAAVSLLHNKDSQDNFISSLRINEEILQLINKIKNKSNASISH